MNTPITTRWVCTHFGVPESTLRHILRRVGAPRPRMHPSARLFLWEPADVEALARFLKRDDESPVLDASHATADAGVAP